MESVCVPHSWHAQELHKFFMAPWLPQKLPFTSFFKCYKYSSSFILLLKGPVAAGHFPLVSSIQQLLFIGDLCPTPQEIKWALIRLKQWRDKLSFKYLLKDPPISSFLRKPWPLVKVGEFDSFDLVFFTSRHQNRTVDGGKESGFS